MNPTLKLAEEWIEAVAPINRNPPTYDQKRDLNLAVAALSIQYDPITGEPRPPRIGEARANIEMAIVRLKGVLSILDDYRPEK